MSVLEFVRKGPTKIKKDVKLTRKQEISRELIGDCRMFEVAHKTDPDAPTKMFVIIFDKLVDAMLEIERLRGLTT